VIKVHHLRHTTASLLKKLRVPPRDAQMILGHAHVSTTMQIYTHVDEEARNQALTGLNDLLSSDE
jgi:integrase